MSRGINPLAILDYGVGWANGGQATSYPPNDPQVFANYCAAVVARYAPMGMKYYELWNEPNNGSYFTAQTYTNLSVVAYNAMKAVDNTITVLAGPSGGGSAGGIDQITFLRDMYTAGVGGYFDALTHHPYGIYWNNLPALHQIMAEHGDGNKKVWLTEFGNPTFGASGQSYVSEAQQATDIVTMVRNIGSLEYAGPLFIYTYRDDQLVSDSSPDREGYFGIIRKDDTKKPAYYALRDTIQNLYR
jgi:hypothetical protein